MSFKNCLTIIGKTDIVLYMKNEKRFTIDTRQLVLCSLFAALIAVGAFIQIPFKPVPITLQWFFVMVSGAVLSPSCAALASAVYILIGLTGIPIFTAGGGIHYVLMPTFGYMLGFILCAYLIGKMAEGGVPLIAANIIATVVLYITGFSYYIAVNYLYLGTAIDWKASLLAFLVLPIPGDIVKSVFAAIVSGRIRKAVRQGNA